MNKPHKAANFKRPKQWSGYTLVEIMVALTLGLFVIMVASGTYVWTARNIGQDDSTARMQENARYALDTITQDLLMSSFTHDLLSDNSLVVDLSVVTLVDGSADCGPTALWSINLSQLVNVLTDVNKSAIQDDYPCIGQEPDDPYLIGAGGFTDIISIKRTKVLTGTGIPDAGDVGKIYLQPATDGTARMVVWDAAGTWTDASLPQNAAFIGAPFFEYLVHIYYVRANRNGIPTLYRKVLEGGEIVTESENFGLAEGVEFFRIMWGIDQQVEDNDPSTFPDGIPDYFVSDTSSLLFPESIIAARIYVLVNSQKFDITYIDEKQYTMGDITLSAGDGTLPLSDVCKGGTDEDHCRRKVFTTTVKLRNQIIKNTALGLIEQ